MGFRTSAVRHAAVHDTSSSTSCKVCFCCAIGAAGPPSLFIADIGPHIAAAPGITLANRFASFIPPGLERPPKSLFIVL